MNEIKILGLAPYNGRLLNPTPLNNKKSLTTKRSTINDLLNPAPLENRKLATKRSTIFDLLNPEPLPEKPKKLSERKITQTLKDSSVKNSSPLLSKKRAKDIQILKELKVDLKGILKDFELEIPKRLQENGWKMGSLEELNHAIIGSNDNIKKKLSLGLSLIISPAGSQYIFANRMFDKFADKRSYIHRSLYGSFFKEEYKIVKWDQKVSKYEMKWGSDESKPIRWIHDIMEKLCKERIHEAYKKSGNDCKGGKVDKTFYSLFECYVKE